MHIADGVLSGPVLGVTGALAAAGVLVGLRKMDYERVPRVGVLSAMFFVASLIHVPVGPSSAHLLLTGLMGSLLGWAAFPALAAALGLQAILFGFGGVTSLGANVLNMALPAVACYYLIARRIRPPTPRGRAFAVAFLAGVAGIVFTCIMTGITLYASGREFLGAVGAIFVGHVPVMVIEGFVTASALVFLHTVRPDLLGTPLVGSPPKEKRRVQERV